MAANEPRDLCEQSPAYVRSIAPYQPGKPVSSSSHRTKIPSD
jgi:hypothetical protein